MSTILVEFVFIFALIMLNGVFAMSELAVVSARKTRLKQRSDEGSATARAALELAESPNRFLSTVQIGITLVGVMTGAFGGATLARILGDAINDVPALAPYSTAIGLGIVVLLITYMTLVLGELVPKRIAMQNPERVAMLVARPMHALSRLTAPAVSLLSASTSLVIHLLRLQDSDEPPITEEEIRILIDQGRQAGVFERVEQDLVESVFALDDRHVSAFMTPHTEVTWLEVDATLDDIRETIAGSRHSSFPVCRGGLDQLLGVVHTKDLLVRVLASEPLVLTDHAQPPYFVPENIAASRAIPMFKEHETQLLIVIDEHGGVQGVLTQHDLLEAFVGDMPSAGDPVSERALLREDGSWLFDGLLHIDEVRERLDTPEFPRHDQGDYQTLGGFMMAMIGCIPQETDAFEWGGWVFEVIDMDERRVDKVLVRRAPLPAPDDVSDGVSDDVSEETP